MAPDFKAYQQQILANARAMVGVFLERGIKIVSGGTDNHLFLVNLVEKGVTGKAVDAALDKAQITVNKNAVPNDPQKPFITSGIRIGTPSVTTRGFKEEECRQVANWICDIIDNIDDAALIDRIRGEVSALCKRFPMYES